MAGDNDEDDEEYGIHPAYLVSEGHKASEATREAIINVPGILSGSNALKKAGMQPEFAGHIIAGLPPPEFGGQFCAILRAPPGIPPQYNKQRCAKSGVIKTKTSNQGLVKGSVAVLECFGRVDNKGKVTPNYVNDVKRLQLPPTDPKYQHVMQLDVTMQDILRETGPEGDLEVLGCEEGQLRLGYKKDRGPDVKSFNGQFIVNIGAGIDKQQLYSREWDNPKYDPNWNPEKKIINKPAELAAVPDGLYEQAFNQSFKVEYSENKGINQEKKTVEVFANKAASVEDFVAVVSKHFPDKLGLISSISMCSTTNQVLEILGDKNYANWANRVILEVYTNASTIVTGDWDGMALSYPISEDNKHFVEAYNIYDVAYGLENQKKLVELSNQYLKLIVQGIESRKLAAQVNGEVYTPSTYEKVFLSLPGKPYPDCTKFIGDFALATAGCISPYEFIFQQVINHAYKDQQNRHYGEQYNKEVVDAMQKSLDELRLDDRPMNEKIASIEVTFRKHLSLNNATPVSPVIFNLMLDHIASHLRLAQGKSEYVLPHLHHDMNVHDLFQHGFDMRNPNGCNLEGPWLIITNDGLILHGETQRQLTQVLLCGTFLMQNRIDVNPLADMEEGWGEVVAKQIELGQPIAKEVQKKYDDYTLKKASEIQKNMKLDIKQVRDQYQPEPKPEPTIPIESQSFKM